MRPSVILEVLDDRDGSRSTIVTSQLPIEHWHAAIGDATLADAILDRLVHNAHQLNLKGAWLRKERANLTSSSRPGVKNHTSTPRRHAHGLHFGLKRVSSSRWNECPVCAEYAFTRLNVESKHLSCRVYKRNLHLRIKIAAELHTIDLMNDLYIVDYRKKQR